MTLSLPITREQVTLLDPADFARFGQFAWCAMPRDAMNGGFYAYRTSLRRTVYLHRLILSAEPHQVVDHINGDGLDNRRSNLRLTNFSGNGANKASPIGASGFRGVERRERAGGRYVYRAYVGGKANCWRGAWMPTAEEAAREYDREALVRFGEFARLNFSTERA